VRPEPATPVAGVETVEALVRTQMSKALGGRRGMIEAAVPTIVFTALWLTTREMRLALGVSVAAAVALLAVRLVQRTTVQFVLNALFGIGIGWLFVTISARQGGSEDDQALAYFLPGILYNAGYSVILAATCLVYLRVEDVPTAVERCREHGVPVESEPHVIFRHEDDAMGPAGTDEWMAFITDSEGNTVGLVSHSPVDAAAPGAAAPDATAPGAMGD
jgi:hypothetical protein